MDAGQKKPDKVFAGLSLQGENERSMTPKLVVIMASRGAADCDAAHSLDITRLVQGRRNP
jgi:hypothetical protein